MATMQQMEPTQPTRPSSRFDGSTGPRIIGPRDGKFVDLGCLGVRFMVWGAESGGTFSLVEHPIPPRTLAAPLHRHEREDEYSYVLEGRMGALLGDEVVYAEAGDLVFKPRGQWHTFWNAGDGPCRILEIISAAGFEHFFDELGDVMAARNAANPGEALPMSDLPARYSHRVPSGEHPAALPGLQPAVPRSAGSVSPAAGHGGISSRLCVTGGGVAKLGGWRDVETLLRYQQVTDDEQRATLPMCRRLARYVHLTPAPRSFPHSDATPSVGAPRSSARRRRSPPPPAGLRAS